MNFIKHKVSKLRILCPLSILYPKESSGLTSLFPDHRVVLSLVNGSLASILTSEYLSRLYSGHCVIISILFWGEWQGLTRYWNDNYGVYTKNSFLRHSLVVTQNNGSRDYPFYGGFSILWLGWVKHNFRCVLFFLPLGKEGLDSVSFSTSLDQHTDFLLS